MSDKEMYANTAIAEMQRTFRRVRLVSYGDGSFDETEAQALLPLKKEGHVTDDFYSEEEGVEVEVEEEHLENEYDEPGDDEQNLVQKPSGANSSSNARLRKFNREYSSKPQFLVCAKPSIPWTPSSSVLPPQGPLNNTFQNESYATHVSTTKSSSHYSNVQHSLASTPLLLSSTSSLQRLTPPSPNSNFAGNENLRMSSDKLASTYNKSYPSLPEYNHHENSSSSDNTYQNITSPCGNQDFTSSIHSLPTRKSSAEESFHGNESCSPVPRVSKNMQKRPQDFRKEIDHFLRSPVKPNDKTMTLENGTTIPMFPVYKEILHADFFHVLSPEWLSVKQYMEDGTFLVRPSSRHTEEEPLTLCLMQSGVYFAFSINMRKDGKYAFGEVKKSEKRFSSIKKLISHHKTNAFRFDGGKHFYFKHPSPKIPLKFLPL